MLDRIFQQRNARGRCPRKLKIGYGIPGVIGDGPYLELSPEKITMNLLFPSVTSLLQENAQKIKLALQLPEDLLYFQGHFPGAPILPGVVQTDWAIHFGRQFFPLKGEFNALEVLKFQKVLRPGDTPTLELEFDAEKNGLRFKFMSALGRHSSGAILFK
jgi:3-hydroxymyristoyl/3-hydroxydecanoyl-(acyl carrier protein) dehydratase